MNDFDILCDMLLDRGFKSDPGMNGNYGTLIMHGPKFHIRAFDGVFQVGFDETFDRWANSVDFEDEIPATEEALDAILNNVGLMKKCQYCTSWKTPHKIANRPSCAECYKKKHRPRKKNDR